MIWPWLGQVGRSIDKGTTQDFALPSSDMVSVLHVGSWNNPLRDADATSGRDLGVVGAGSFLVSVTLV